MKQRVSALDLLLITRELKGSIERYRLSNIYNIADSNRQFLLKFNKPDSKVNVVVDCGSKVHITEFSRHISSAPSGFVSKLRKHLKAKRLTGVRQVPNDRILVLQFADGKYYLVLEFFSAGNVILLDENRNILSLQRIVQEHENKVGEKYEMFDPSLFASESVCEQEAIDFNVSTIQRWLVEEKQYVESSKVNMKKRTIHKLLLSNAPYLSSDLLSKNLKCNLIDPEMPSLQFEDKLLDIVNVLQQSDEEYRTLINEGNTAGFIVEKKNPNYVENTDQANLEYTFESFHPFEPFLTKKNQKIIRIEGSYNQTLDNFFSTVESSKYQLKIQTQEQLAKKKLGEARSENNKRIQELEKIQSTNEEKGNLLISNASLVEDAKMAVQGLMDQQIDWSTIEKLIKTEQNKGNKIAKIINLPLKLKKNQVDLSLPVHSEEAETCSDSSDDDNLSSDDFSSDSDSDTEDTTGTVNNGNALKKKKSKSKGEPKTMIVTVDLSLSAYANAGEYFNAKKATSEKQKKVEKNVEKAMKNIETRVNKQLKQKLNESHKVLKKLRTPYFFEKYNWFLSSEGYMVLNGKSDVETDQIYSRYIKDDDIFVSNSYGNCVWILNPEKGDVPPNTLMQAGIMCMSVSEAWSKKIAASAWWCTASNISKFSDHDNSVLPSGHFRCKREDMKYILSPAQLVMGMGFLWRIKSNLNDSSEDEDENKEIEEAETVEGDTEFKNIPRETESIPSTEFIETDVEIHRESPKSGVLPEKGIVEDTENTEDTVKLIQHESNQNIAKDIVDNMNKKVRGKRGKLKKMQKKYRDQDETERLIRLEALGTLKGVEKDIKKEQEKLLKEQDNEYRKAKREKQKELQKLQFTAHEKRNINHSRYKSELKACLSSDDEVLDIIPVFAPWAALQKYKYKLKIQPGNGKKTKSMNELLTFMLRQKVDTSCTDRERVWPKEQQLIKSISAQDLVVLLYVDKMVLSIPGSGNKSIKSAKGKTKHNKKKQ